MARPMLSFVSFTVCLIGLKGTGSQGAVSALRNSLGDFI